MRITSSRLAYLGDGRLACRRDRGLEIRAPDGRVQVELPVEGAIDLGVVGSAVWAVAREPMRIVTWDPRSGDLVTSPVALPAAGRLHATSLAPDLAIWQADARAHVLTRSAGAITVADTIDGAELAIPVAGGRLLILAANMIRLVRGGAELWRVARPHPADRVLGGAATFEGRGVLLVQRAPGDAVRLVLLGTSDGAVQLENLVTGAETIRVASRRGHAFVHGAGRVTILDIRFGRALGRSRVPAAAADLAVDDTAQRIAFALELPDGVTVSSVPIRGLANAELDDATDDALPEVADAVPEAPSAVPGPPGDLAPAQPRGDEPPLDRQATLLAFGSPPVPPATRPAHGRAVTDALAQLVGTWVERAIAVAWDCGRIAHDSATGMPFESEVRGVLAQGRGRAEDRIRAADLHIAQRTAAVNAAIEQLGGEPSPLARLGEQFELTPVEALVLLVVAAPTHLGELARLYAILASDSGRAYCDELAVCQILDGRADRADIARALDPDRPLLRCGLVVQAPGVTRPFASLCVDPTVARALRGQALDLDGDAELRRSTRAVDLDRIHAPRAVLASALTRLQRPLGGPLRLAVRGRVGSGRRTLVTALARMAGRDTGLIDLTALGATRDARLDALPRALRRALIRGWLPCLEGLEDLVGDDGTYRERLRLLLRTHPGPVAVRMPWDVAPPYDPGYVAIDLPVLTETERLHVWNVELARAGLHVPDVTELAARYRIGPGVVRAVTDQVAASTTDADKDATVALDAAIRQHVDTRLGTITTRVTRTAAWSEVVLPDEIVDSLLELVARIRHRRTVFDAWGFDRTMTTSRGVTALFQGGPGTGKTMVAGVVARELGLDLYRIDLSRTLSKWIGETEKNLAEVFDAAEDGQALLLFDEADALFSRRTQVRTSNDRFANLEVNYLLQRFDSFEGVAILTTNFGGSIDPAFARRLSLRLTFPFPDDEMRERLWRAHLPPQLPREGTFDLADLARRFRMSGGYIRNAALRAAFLAAEEGVPLTHAHLERAIRLEFREIGKLADSGTLE